MHAVACATLMALTACGPSDPADAAPVGRSARHLVLISLDTVRADRLGCYGHAQARTPRIDALAADGVRFDAAIAPAPTTLASHASMHTGLAPHAHGVPRNGFVLSDDAVTLAEVLRSAGYRTLAAVGAAPLSRAHGLAQGFDRYDDSIGAEKHERGYAERSARDVTRAALALVDEALESDAQTRAVFLFAHYFDVHAPYAPPPSARTVDGPIPRTLDAGILRAADDHYEALTGERPGRAVNRDGLPADIVRAVEASRPRPSALDERLSQLYDDELASLDVEVGRLLDGLDARGLLADSVVLLTADHGETTWEHADFWSHGLALYDTTLRVPLVVCAPGVGGGRHARMPVSGVDVPRTVLGLVGVPAPGAMGGVDLGPLVHGGASGFDHGPVFSEATLPWGVEDSAVMGPETVRWLNREKPKAIRAGRWKYVSWGYSGLEQLFDLECDPGEQRDLLRDPDAGALASAHDLRAQLMAWAAGARPFPAEPVRGVTAARSLKALGYTGPSPAVSPH